MIHHRRSNTMAMLHVQAIGAAASPPAQVNDIADSPPCQRRQPHIVFSPSLDSKYPPDPFLAFASAFILASVLFHLPVLC